MRPKLADLDIVIPVYNEGANIISVLDALKRDVKSSFRILICYDFDDDNTLEAISAYPDKSIDIVLVKNPGRGPHSAIKAGLDLVNAPAVLTHMADDDYTTHHIDYMIKKSQEGFEIVTGSRFMKGGEMKGCVWYKKFLTWLASFTLYHFARFPIQDATHGVRIFSRRILDEVRIESDTGFTFSFEMMVKVVRLSWKIHEFPVGWYERKKGKSRFQIWKWMWPYLHWYFFAYQTAWLRKGPESVVRRKDGDTI